MVQIGEDVLIYDIETKTFGRPDANRDIFKAFGCYSYKTKKSYVLFNRDDVQRVVNAHKILVGFNNEKYDNPILKRFGIDLNYKIFIDLLSLFRERAGAMKVDEGLLKDILMEYNLDYITRTLKLVTEEEAKLKFDYTILRKDSWTSEELLKIKEYTERDIDITRRLYEWVETFFEGFKAFVNEDDTRKKKYLTVSIAKYSYKAICRAMGWTEEYGQGIAGDEEDHISGGYVSYPAEEEIHSDEQGDVYSLDFGSEYPHAMMMANLYGRKKPGEINDRPIWTGGGVWKVEGVYYADKMSDVGLLIRRWYFNRMYYKRTFLCYDDKKLYKMKDIEKFRGKKIYAIPEGRVDPEVVTVDDYWVNKFNENVAKGVDKREFSIKTIVVTIYGILNTAYYTKVFDMVAGGDCTRLGRQWVKYARKVFREKGYKVLYTDTDSVYIKDPYKDKERMLRVKQEIIDFIKSTVPFPQDTYDMAVENEIQHLFFFKGGNKEKEETEMDSDDFINKPKGLMKKNYIIVTKDKKLIIKNLGIKKKSNSPLSRKIFWDDLVPQIVEKGQVRFSKTYLRNKIIEYLEKDISLAAMRKDVGPPSDYSGSPTSIQAQISTKYGEGIHFLVPNTKGIGVGKGVSLCTLEEFKQHNLKLEHVDLTNIWSELEYFTKTPVTVNIFQFK